MPNDAATLARRLAQSVEAVCGHYLSNGRRRGRYWQVGDVHNTPGQSLYVRLAGPVAGPGAAGKWTDAATGEHGDLLDLIALNLGLTQLRDVLEEARRFLSLPTRESTPAVPVPRGSGEAARRLFAASRPIAGTLAACYLRARGITCAIDLPALRFHPACYRRDDDGALRQGPALIAAVTGLDGRITGVQRTWLAPDGLAKADMCHPRRSMGELLGHGIRVGRATQVLAAGEGLETMLALRSLLPSMPIVAATSASHLAVIALPSGLKRLYIALDNDAAGRRAAAALLRRATQDNICATSLVPVGADWNADLVTLGHVAALAHVRSQLREADVRAPGSAGVAAGKGTGGPPGGAAGTAGL